MLFINGKAKQYAKDPRHAVQLVTEKVLAHQNTIVKRKKATGAETLDPGLKAGLRELVAYIERWKRDTDSQDDLNEMAFLLTQMRTLSSCDVNVQLLKKSLESQGYVIEKQNKVFLQGVAISVGLLIGSGLCFASGVGIPAYLLLVAALIPVSVGHMRDEDPRRIISDKLFHILEAYSSSRQEMPLITDENTEEFCY